MISPERMLAKAALAYAKGRGALFLRKRGGKVVECAKRIAEDAAHEAGRLKARFDLGVEEYRKRQAEQKDPQD